MEFGLVANLIALTSTTEFRTYWPLSSAEPSYMCLRQSYKSSSLIDMIVGDALEGNAHFRVFLAASAPEPNHVSSTAQDAMIIERQTIRLRKLLL